MMNDPTTNALNRLRMLSKAISRMFAGPPMSDQGRYNQKVTEARARSFEGSASAWFQPR
jgi:hypothetical protein